MVPVYDTKSDLFQIDVGNRMDFPPHLHLDMELLYVQKGWIAAQAGDGEYQVGAGSYFSSPMQSMRTGL